MTLTTEQQEWVDALRSGAWEQYQHALADPKGGPGRCCLGVGCEVSGLGEWTRLEVGNMGYLGDYGVLPHSVQDRLGLRGNNGAFRPFEQLDWLNRLPVSTKDKMLDVKIKCGMTRQNELSLIVLNDEYGFTFDEIADVIEANPPGLFVERKGVSHGDV